MDKRDFYEKGINDVRRLRALEEEEEDDDEFSPDVIEQEMKRDPKNVTIDFSIHADRDFLVGQFIGAVSPESELIFFYVLVNYKMQVHILDEKIPVRIINIE